MNSVIKILIGVAGAGKSTYAKNTEGLVLSSDSIREELFGALEQTDNNKVFTLLKKRLFEAVGKESVIIYDATNINKKRRSNLYQEVKKKFPETIVECVIYLRPLQYLYDINDGREEYKKVPAYKIKQMYFTLDVPRVGYDCDVFSVEGSSFDEFEKEYKQFGVIEHETPYHLESINDHINWAIRNAGEDEFMKEIASFHDLGKFITKEKLDDNRCRYIGHDRVSAQYWLSQYTGHTFNYNPIVLNTIAFHMFGFDKLSEKLINRYNLTEKEVLTIQKFGEIDNKSRIIDSSDSVEEKEKQ